MPYNTMMDKLVAAAYAEFQRQGVDTGEYVDVDHVDGGVSLDGDFNVKPLIRAMLTALREPTIPMLDKCHSVRPENDGEGGCWITELHGRELLNAMLDEAMK